MVSEVIEKGPGTHVSGSIEQVAREVTITHRQGFHTRPVMKFVDMAQRFVAEISVVSLTREEEAVDGKSAMELMLLGATQGTRLRISAVGPDAAGAVDALVELVRTCFDLDE